MREDVLVTPLWKRMARSNFFQSVTKVAGGTALAQGIGVLASPIIARLYTPEDMSLWGLFVSFVGVASVVTTLRYEVAVVAARTEEEARCLAVGSLVVSGGLSVLAVGVFEFLRQKDIFGFGLFHPWASLLVGLALAATSWAMILRYFATRLGAFHIIGRVTVFQALWRIVAQVGLSFLGPAGLVLGEVAGRWAGLRSLWRGFAQTIVLWRNAWTTLWNYRRYPFVQLPSSILDTMALMAPVPVFTSIFGAAAGGGLALAQRVVGLPLALIGGSVADVFYGRAAELLRMRPRALLAFFLTTSLWMLVLGVALGFAMWAMGPWITVKVFGPRWEEAGLMLRAMAPWMAAQMAVSPVSRVVFLSPYSWLKLVYDFTALLAVSLPLWWKADSAVHALFLVAWVKVALYVLYFLVLLLIVTQVATYPLGQRK
jgi:O-antigen/teichoic acid export membrane protein